MGIEEEWTNEARSWKWMTSSEGNTKKSSCAGSELLERLKQRGDRHKGVGDKSERGDGWIYATIILTALSLEVDFPEVGRDLGPQGELPDTHTYSIYKNLGIRFARKKASSNQDLSACQISGIARLNDTRAEQKLNFAEPEQVSKQAGNHIPLLTEH